MPHWDAYIELNWDKGRDWAIERTWEKALFRYKCVQRVEEREREVR